MNAAPNFRLEPVDGLITIAAAYTPTANIHDPDSTYSRYYWPSTTGPTGFLAWSQLAAWLPAPQQHLHMPAAEHHNAEVSCKAPCRFLARIPYAREPRAHYRDAASKY